MQSAACAATVLAPYAPQRIIRDLPWSAPGVSSLRSGELCGVVSVPFLPHSEYFMSASGTINCRCDSEQRLANRHAVRVVEFLNSSFGVSRRSFETQKRQNQNSGFDASREDPSAFTRHGART